MTVSGRSEVLFELIKEKAVQAILSAQFFLMFLYFIKYYAKQQHYDCYTDPAEPHFIKRQFMNKKADETEWNFRLIKCINNTYQSGTAYDKRIDKTVRMPQIVRKPQ